MVEIKFPSNAWDDVLMVKLKEYFEIGIQEVWVVSIAVRIGTVFRLLRDTWTLAFACNYVLASPGLCASSERGFFGAAATGVRLTIASMRVAILGVFLTTNLEFPAARTMLVPWPRPLNLSPR